MKSAPPSIPSLVPANWLASHLRDPDLVVLDCSWYLPSAGRDPELEYQAAHIPGALRFDLDAASDAKTSLPHMLPTPEEFAAYVERLGVHSDDKVVCYDGSGVNLSAARVWWMFRAFGHRNVAVLDGGFGAWTSVTRSVQRGVTRRSPLGYPPAQLDQSLVRDRTDVERLVANPGDEQVVDGRAAARFNAEVDEPRPGVRRGNIPGSVNLPFDRLTDPDTGLMRSPAELEAILTAQGIDIERPIVSLCGSGTSACALALAVEVVRESGRENVGPPVAVYDGSWAEWGATNG